MLPKPLNPALYILGKLISLFQLISDKQLKGICHCCYELAEFLFLAFKEIPLACPVEAGVVIEVVQEMLKSCLVLHIG